MSHIAQPILHWFREYLEIVASKDINLGVINNKYGQIFGFGYRGFTSRCELNKSTLHNCKGPSFLRGQSTVTSWPVLNLHHHYATQATATENKSRKMLFYLVGLVFAMVGASYAAVPLYRRFCQATGYGGTIQRREVSYSSLMWLWIGFQSPEINEIYHLTECWRKDCPTRERWKSYFQVLHMLLTWRSFLL